MGDFLGDVQIVVSLQHGAQARFNLLQPRKLFRVLLSKRRLGLEIALPRLNHEHSETGDM